MFKNSVLKTFVLLLAFSVLPLIYAPKTYAAYDAVCVAEGVANYMDTVVSALGNSRRYKYISPVFNMTEPQFTEFYAAVATASATFGNANVIVGGNAYNMDGNTVTDWVNAARTETDLKNRPLFITETGWYPHADPSMKTDAVKNALKAEFEKMKNDTSIVSALVFNGFGTGNNSQFGGQVMLPEEWDYVCGGPCGKFGNNTAAVGMMDPAYYDKVKGVGGGFSLTILPGPNVSEVAAGVNLALSKGVTPVLRIGYGDADYATALGFENPQVYIQFLKDLESQITETGPVYVIVGPNEPNAEGWADPDGPNTCSRDGSTATASGTIKIRGQVYTNLPVKTGTNSIKYGAFLGKVKITAYTGIPAVTTTGDPPAQIYPTEKLNIQTCQNEGVLMGQSRLLPSDPMPFGGSPCTDAVNGCPNVVTTDDNGYFEINLRRSFGCRRDKNIFLVAYGGQGSDTDKVLDMWLVSTKRNYEPLYIGVNAVAREVQKGSLKIYEIESDDTDPPAQLSYVDRTRFLACSAPNPFDDFFNSLTQNWSKGYTGDNTFLDIKFADDRGKDARNAPTSTTEDIRNLAGGINWVDSGTGSTAQGDGIPDALAAEEMSGRVVGDNRASNLNAETMARCSIVGGYGCSYAKPREYPDTSIQEVEIPSCEKFQLTNSPIVPNGVSSQENSKMYSTGVLAATVNSAHKATFSTQGALYMQYCSNPALKQKMIEYKVCKNGGDELNIFDIQSPWYMDPEVAACTGKPIGCIPGQSGCYKLDQSYFPYDINMVGLEVQGQYKEETKATNDSYDSIPRYVKFLPPLTGSTANDNAVLGKKPNTESSFASEGKWSVQRGGPFSAKGVLATEEVISFTTPSGENVIVPPPDALMQDPKTTSTDTTSSDTTLKKRYEFVKQSLAPIRIGRIKNVCIKSTMDPNGIDPINLIYSVLGTVAERDSPWTGGYSHVTGNNVDTQTKKGTFFGVVVPDLIAGLLQWFSTFTTQWTTGDLLTNPPDQFFFNADANCTLQERDWTDNASKDCPADGGKANGYVDDLGNGIGRKGVLSGDCTCKTTIDPATQDCVGGWEQRKIQEMAYRCDDGTNTYLETTTKLGVGKIGERQLLNMASMVLGPNDSNVVPSRACIFDTSVHNASKGVGLGGVASCGLDNTSVSEQFIYNALQDPKYGKNYSFINSRRKLSKNAKVPVIPSEVGNCGLAFNEPYRIIPSLPDYAVSVIERAGFHFNVPAAALIAAMYAEGSFNPGKYTWTEDAVMNGSIQGEYFMPGGGDECPDIGAGEGAFNVNRVTWNDMIKGSNPKAMMALQKDFPGRIPNRCNFLDGAYVAAARIQEAANGASTYASDRSTYIDSEHPNRCPQLIGGSPVLDCTRCFGVSYAGIPAATCDNWSFQNTVAMSRGYSGYCHDDKGSGASPDEPPMCNANQSTEALCRESYTQCGDGQCSSYVANMYYVMEKYKRGSFQVTAP